MERLSVLPAVQTVRAIHDFKGENNDELCFSKGDVITLTQTPEGGWYEGTLNDMTGWFPSNYVEAIDLSSSPTDQLDSFEPASLVSNTQNVENRKLVVKEIIDSEALYIKELDCTYQSFLIPLQEANILPEKDIEQVMSAISQVIAVHSQLLESLKMIQQKSSSRSLRVGGAFMEYSLKVKEAHLRYCSWHPKFIAGIEKQKEAINKFMKTTNSVSKEKEGSVQLTSGLSYTFRRLDKYPALLQELQRYTEEADPDRGDTQRAGFLYREFVSSCLEIRRLKEMEIEVMLGNIKNWPPDSSTIESFGQVVHMGPVIVTHSPEEGDVSLSDRYLVLFERDLLLLSVSKEMTSFNFETKMSLQQVTLPRLPPHSGLDSFELLVTKTGTSVEEACRFVFQCSTNEDVKTWISQMYQCKKGIEATLKSLDQVRASFRSQRNGNRSTTTGSESSVSVSSGCSWADGQPPMFRQGFWANRSLLSHAPHRLPDVDGRLNTLKKSLGVNSLSIKCTSAADDLAILQVIESYCSVGKKSRQVVASRDAPSPVIAKEEGGEMDMKKLVEELRMVRKELKQVKQDVNLVAENLEKEKRARKRLKQFVTRIPFQLND